MQDLSNPTADELIVLASAQRNRLKVLNVLPMWDDEDMENLLLSYHQWDAERSLWCIPVTDLSRLAFDARTPEVCSRWLQQLIQHAKATNQTTIHPQSFFEP